MRPGGLFLTYCVYRNWYADAFTAASRELIVWAGTTNTAVLITSSLTMALAVRAAQTGQRRLLMILLAATMALGCVFLGIKAFEYYAEYIAHHVPGAGFQFEAEHYRHAQIFFSLYFLMTGLHGVHVIIGMIVITWMLVRTIKGDFHSKYFFPVELTGLYWHLVDLIWIFLYPLLYLI